MGTGGIWEISVPSSQFCCEPKRWFKKKTKTRKVRASLIAQLVNNLPAMQETLVRFLGWEVLLEMG